ncbi:MAG: energy-coupling factor transporter transmembrane protein EcfT [Streptomycetaceae bacterium]|nr:MAG: energy-coupling factor transporter transmembrane protein EcfT [Streptomycetaceae bacterium]
MKKFSLHPLTWWIWSLAIAISVARVNSPIFAIAAVGVMGIIIITQREDAPWGKSFTWTLKVAAWILFFRSAIGVLIGVPIPGTTIFSLPIMPLPHWMPGIRIGGAVTLERLSSALSEGVIICAIIVVFGAAASLTSPHRLLRVLPIYIYEFGVAVVIATSVLPQLVTSVGRIRQAQRLRGQKAKGFSSYKRVAIPLLEESLARSLELAAAMDSRGYAFSRKRSRYRPILWTSRDTAIVLSGVLVIALT